MTISIILLYKSLQIQNSICFIRIIWEILGLFRIKRECPFLHQLRTNLYPEFFFEYFSALLLYGECINTFLHLFASHSYNTWYFDNKI